MQPKGPAWLGESIFYEIYPQSFFDSNGDGIGDLAGVIAKLDYVQSLGCNGIWLNPCFVSPFNDAGYDISDYYKVAPRYGTNRDLKRLFAEAHRRGIRVVLDLVVGHTSTEHPWFIDSCRRAPNAHSNWYVWTDIWYQADVPGLRLIGGYSPKIDGFDVREGCYAANFFHFQPALNFGFCKPDPEHPWQLPTDHPDVMALREEIKRILRFWLDLGADGFRVDMASKMVKGDDDFKATCAYWAEVRAMLDAEYPEAALISEWSSPSHALRAGFHADFLLHMSPEWDALFRAEQGRSVYIERDGHSFFSAEGQGNVCAFFDWYLKLASGTRRFGHISLASGNHDVPRISVGRTTREIELVFAFIMTMPGVPYIYYGDEIGMRYFRDLPSKEGGYNRTGARTPMQWGPGRTAGFSKAPIKQCYLPVDPDPARPTVAAQEADPGSLLNRVRALTALRRESIGLWSSGDFEPLFIEPDQYPIVYLRRQGRERRVVAINPAARAVECTIAPPGGARATRIPETAQIGGGVRIEIQGDRWRVAMDPISYGVFEV